MIEGSGQDTMDGETRATRADAEPPFHDAQRLRPSGGNAGGNNPTDRPRARVNTATIEPFAYDGSHPRLGGTGHALTPA
jgi:hypothetical protein